MLPHLTATAYLTPLREGGSLPGLVEADDLGTYVVKFTGAGQGPRALVAETQLLALTREVRAVREADRDRARALAALADAAVRIATAQDVGELVDVLLDRALTALRTALPVGRTSPDAPARPAERADRRTEARAERSRRRAAARQFAAYPATRSAAGVLLPR